ncbi:unnamed protein product [Amoebophrya sp. A120]|nr:unnamed protein product [Amoebophrya sp. A120]|eukprot:GSA120T00016591001.1
MRSSSDHGYSILKLEKMQMAPKPTRCVAATSVLLLLLSSWFAWRAGTFVQLEEVFSTSQYAAWVGMQAEGQLTDRLPSWARECKTIYMDMGSNRGVQVRKLFEPERYPNSLVFPIFQAKYYDNPEDETPKMADGPATPPRPMFRGGTGSSSPRPQGKLLPSVCAFGFEPNPNHHLRLARLQAAYQSRGWRVHFFPRGVWVRNETLTFTGRQETKSVYSLSEGGARLVVTAKKDHNGAGATSRQEPKTHHAGDVKIQTIDIADLLRTLQVGQRATIPYWKMDIEGAEWRVLPYLKESGFLSASRVAEIGLEYHCGPEYDQSFGSSAKSWMPTAECFAVTQAAAGKSPPGMKASILNASPTTSKDPFGDAVVAAVQKRLNPEQSWLDSLTGKARQAPVTKILNLDDETYVNDGGNSDFYGYGAAPLFWFVVMCIWNVLLLCAVAFSHISSRTSLGRSAADSSRKNHVGEPPESAGLVPQLPVGASVEELEMTKTVGARPLE